jgi:hypothetical protein
LNLLDCGVVEEDCAEILDGVVCGADVGMDEEEEGSFVPSVAVTTLERKTWR